MASGLDLQLEDFVDEHHPPSQAFAEIGVQVDFKTYIYLPPYCAVLYCTVLHCTVLYGTVRYCAVLHGTVRYCTIHAKYMLIINMP